MNIIYSQPPHNDKNDKHNSLADVLINYFSSFNSPTISKNHAVVLKYWDEIAKAVDLGWSMIDIWRAMHHAGLITFSYSAFIRYIALFKKRRRIAEGAIGKSQTSTGEKEEPGNPDPNMDDARNEGKPLFSKIETP